MNEICAVIVTYNRPELLCRCVKHLMCQDYPLDILIYDNHSSLDTKKALKNDNLLCENVLYYYAENNTGGAGGFHYGMKMAMSKNQYRAIWLMDDDGYPINTDTLSKLINAWRKINTNMCILNSLVVCDSDSLRLSFSLNREYDGKKIINGLSDNLLKDLVSPFNGTLIPVELIRKIGYPLKEFFIYGDETEYILRAKQNGALIYTAVDSIYWHPTVVEKTKKLFQYQIAIGDIPLWKTYCMARNTVFYVKKYFGIKLLIKKVLRMYLECFFVSGEKWLQFKETTKGIVDGLKGEFGRKLDLSK